MIAIGSDHAGYSLKKEIIRHLEQKGITVKDLGTFDDSTSVDYPDYGIKVAEAVRDNICQKGIIICGTGIGISISANKVPGIIAALCTDTYMARMSIEHNNANILALGARVTGTGSAIDIVDIWLNSSFAFGKHETRVKKIKAIEQKYQK